MAAVDHDHPLGHTERNVKITVCAQNVYILTGCILWFIYPDNVHDWMGMYY